MTDDKYENPALAILMKNGSFEQSVAAVEARSAELKTKGREEVETQQAELAGDVRRAGELVAQLEDIERQHSASIQRLRQLDWTWMGRQCQHGEASVLVRQLTGNITAVSHTFAHLSLSDLARVAGDVRDLSIGDVRRGEPGKIRQRVADGEARPASVRAQIAQIRYDWARLIAVRPDLAPSLLLLESPPGVRVEEA